jgi:hypothetical protein
MADVPNLLVLDQLTEQQSQELMQFALHWHHVVREQAPDRNEVGAAIARLYKAAKIDGPLILWCESPWQIVTMRAMLGLLGIGVDSSLRQNLASELQDPLWKQMWQKLNEQIDHLHLEVVEGEHLSIEELFGSDATTDIKLSVSGKIGAAQEKVTDQLSLHIKLRLREVFRGLADENGERRWMERTPLIVAEFGIVQLRELLGDLAREFLSQLTPETQKAVNDLCKARLKPSTANLFGLSAPAKEPVEQLFETLQVSLNSPTTMHDLDPVAFVLKYLPVVVAEEIREPVLDWLTIKDNLFHIECFEKLCIACEAPIRAELNQRNQLHNAHGPALEFRDGCKIYAWNGVVVPAVAIEATRNITVEQIDKQENVEVRRILIQQYGLDRYLDDSGAVEVDADEYGVLYKKVLPNDEPVVVVRVTNPTPELDGTHKFYFLRVPPHITSAHAAVAWTFNMKPEQYQPASQS